MRKIAGILSIFLTTTLFAQPDRTTGGFPSNTSTELQQILDDALPIAANPGAVMTIHIPGEYTWSGASGYSITGTSMGYPTTPANATDQYRVGSITKLMVATAVLQLEEAGLLSLTDSIGTYLRASLVQDTIQSSETVTIYHLLNHTSGIANSAANMSCQQNALSDLTRYFPMEEAVACGASQGEYFPPGFAWGYSNTNYTLLAMIIEEVTGTTVGDYLSTNIFTPLGLTNTYVPTANELTESHMGCYWNIGAPFGLVDMTIVNPSLYKGWADVVSTSEELTLFLDALLSGELITETSLTKMKTIDAVSFDYGLGMEFYDINPDGYYGHSGEVGNTNGLFYSNLSTDLIPNGYYIAYNFNYQGVASLTEIDQKVYNYLSTLEAEAVSGIEEVSETNLTLYPNPSNGLVTINGEFEKATATLQLLDGMLINTTTTTGTLDYSNLEKGIYLLTIATSNTTKTEKLIIK